MPQNTHNNSNNNGKWRPSVDHDNKDSHADGVFGVDHGTIVDKKIFTYQPPSSSTTTATSTPASGDSSSSSSSYMSFDFSSVKLSDPATWKPLVLPVGGGLLLLLVFIVVIR